MRTMYLHTEATQTTNVYFIYSKTIWRCIDDIIQLIYLSKNTTSTFVRVQKKKIKAITFIISYYIKMRECVENTMIYNKDRK